MEHLLVPGTASAPENPVMNETEKNGVCRV